MKMKKILLFTSISLLLSACGGGGDLSLSCYLLPSKVSILLSDCKGGGGGDKDSASTQSTRNDLEITEKSLGVSRFQGVTIQNERSSTNAYNPNYTVNLNKAKVAGNSTMTFGNDGTITLNSELCVTNDNDCGAIRAAALKNGTVKLVNNGWTKSVNARKTLYSRYKIVISDNQKIAPSIAKRAFGALADTFDLYIIDSDKLANGDRSSLNGAKWVDISGDNRDAFHNPKSTNYWTNNGVKESTGGKSRIFIVALATKKGEGFAKYARLGIMEMSQTLSNGEKIELDFVNIAGEYTTAANLGQVGARYAKTNGWHAMGGINNQFAYMQGDVDITIDVTHKKITKFNVENMTYTQSKTNRVKSFLSGTKLQLANNTALSYGADGEYKGTLTENGGATGQNDKWDTTLEGNFFGPKAQETAGVITMQKNGHTKDNDLIGGFAAEKDNKGWGDIDFNPRKRN